MMPLSHDVTDPKCKIHDPDALEAERVLGGLTQPLPVGTCQVCGADKKERA